MTGAIPPVLPTAPLAVCRRRSGRRRVEPDQLGLLGPRPTRFQRTWAIGRATGSPTRNILRHREQECLTTELATLWSEMAEAWTVEEYKAYRTLKVGSLLFLKSKSWTPAAVRKGVCGGKKVAQKGQPKVANHISWSGYFLEVACRFSGIQLG
jgi:hypothetical protein